MSQQNSNFKIQQRRWYKILKETGFIDIEQDEDNLKSWHSHYFAHTWDPLRFVSRETYYQLAGRFLHDHKFETKVEKAVWQLYSEGKDYRSIQKILKKNRIKCSKDKANKIVKQLEKKMLEIYNGND